MKDGEDPREVLGRFRQAAIDRSVDKLAAVYAVDAIHEFPFTRPGMPSRLTGREEIISFTAASWEGGFPKYEGYRTIAIHQTDVPHTIVVEQEALGVNAAGRSFALPNIVVLTAVKGQITQLRDYVNVSAAAAVKEGS